MKEKDLQSELRNIRSLMDRSTKFVSLSGLSGILAGTYAFVGGSIAWLLIRQNNIAPEFYRANSFKAPGALIMQIYCIAAVVLVLSVSTAVWLTVRKVTEKEKNTWNSGRRELVSRMSAPLVSGGLLMNIFLFQGEFYGIASISLIFYGLALVAGSYYIISLVKYLGYCEIILGLMAALFPGYGLYFWITGFGLLHIIYGSIMHFKYER